MRKTCTTRDLRKYFVHKGRTMRQASREVSPSLIRQRDRAHHQVLSSIALSTKGLRPKRILDIGTGYGMNLTFLACRFGKSSRIWSVDASPGVVREVKKMMRAHEYSRHIIVRKANSQELPFKNDRFDLIVSMFLIHHLSSPTRGLSEMGRVLSQGGKLIIADWKPTAAKPLKLHKQSEIPSPTFVINQLKRLGYSTKIRIGRYWYLIEASK